MAETPRLQEPWRLLPVRADSTRPARKGEERENRTPGHHARGEELDRKARDFEAIARDTRFAWIRTNLHTLTREQTVAGICELALAETVGWHSMFVSQPIHGEGVVEALIGLDGICRSPSMTATTGRWNARRTSTRSAWC